MLKCGREAVTIYSCTPSDPLSGPFPCGLETFGKNYLRSIDILSEKTEYLSCKTDEVFILRDKIVI